MPYADKKAKLKDQPELFDDLPVYSWESEWVGMPEFVCEYKEDYASVIIHFNSEEEVQQFEKTIGRKIPRGTRNNRPSIRLTPQETKPDMVYVDKK